MGNARRPSFKGCCAMCALGDGRIRGLGWSWRLKSSELRQFGRQTRIGRHDIPDDQWDDEDEMEHDLPTGPAWVVDALARGRRFRSVGTETFDCEADMGYVQIRPNTLDFDHSVESAHVVMDYDTAGRLTGYELLRPPVEVAT